MYWIFAIGGYVGAAADRLLRVPDRLPGRRRASRARRRRSSSRATSPTPTPTNPHTGEPEDTDVGFPGAEHHIAEREWPMRVAMAVLGVRRPVRRPDPDPGRRRRGHHVPRRAPSRARRSTTIEPVDRRRLARARGRRRDLDRRDRARLLLLRAPARGHRAAGRAPAAACTPSCSTSGTSTSSIDALVYRPAIAIGRFANAVVERVVVARDRQRGATGVVKGVGSVVRGAQSGFVRAYALLLVGGFAALGLYFLVVSELMLNVLALGAAGAAR